ncbi:MAG: hypothetical protein ACYDBH_24445, partial [Acidobacteriaceae bacterium]
SGSKSGSGRWSHWHEIGWVHYPEIGWSHFDEIRGVQSLEILHTETGRALPDTPDAPLPSSLRNTMNTMMAQMQMMQTQFTQMFSRMNQVFAAAFSPPAMPPLNRPNHLMQTSAHSVTRAPLSDHRAAVLM